VGIAGANNADALVSTNGIRADVTN
jgi:hypothetical protein